MKYHITLSTWNTTAHRLCVTFARVLIISPRLQINRNIRRPSQSIHYLRKTLVRSRKSCNSLDIVQSQCQTNIVLTISLYKALNKPRLSRSWQWRRINITGNDWKPLQRFYSSFGIRLTFPPWLRGGRGGRAVGSTLFLFFGFCLHFRLFLLHLHWLRLFLWFLLLHQRWSRVFLSLQDKKANQSQHNRHTFSLSLPEVKWEFRCFLKLSLYW